MKRLATIVLFVALAACSKKKDDGGAGMASGSAMVAPGSGSAAVTDTGSGSAGSAGSGSAAGAGSAMAAGSGSDTGSGSAASGSGSAVAAGSGAGSGSAAAEEKSEFDKLTSEKKAEFMKTKVVPAMKEAFQKFDAKAFANFGCKTCHGKDPKGSKYKMPNPALPKLDFVALQAGKQKPKMAEFMGKVVKPEMAKILGDKELDPKHPELGGFGCLECHEQKK